MTLIVKPVEDTQINSIGASNVYSPPQSGQLLATASNSATPSKGVVSVDSTAQFIRAHYDELFRRLAE